MINENQTLFLKVSFIIGVIADFIVGINWLLISYGFNIPSLISSFKGAGQDYRFAMYICTMLMFGWTAILCWGYLRPIERRGLLLITAVLLSISIMIELLYYRDVLAGIGFISGVIIRLLLITKFAFSYFYSFAKYD